jgi:hypothetical protein
VYDYKTSAAACFRRCFCCVFNLTYIVSFQPLYNQPSDTAVYHENKRRYVVLNFVSNFLFEVADAVAGREVVCCNSGFN